MGSPWYFYKGKYKYLEESQNIYIFGTSFEDVKI